MQSRHWSIVAAMGIAVANNAASALCGHSVDVTTVDYASMAYSMILGGADFIHTHFGNYQSTSQPQPTPTPVTTTPTGLTPDG